MGKKRIYELAKEMNKASKDVVDKAHQLGMDVKNHMGAISSEQETKLRQAFGGGSTVNTQSKATNNQKQQTTQNKPANKKPMNNKPGEQRNNQNRPNNQSTNGQQRNNNNQNRHGQSNTQNRSNQTNTNNQNRNTQNNNGSTTNQNRTNQNNNGGNNQNRGGQNRNNNFGGGQNRNNRNNFNNQNRNRFNKKGKKGKHQQESAKPAVPARKFRELPDVLEYTEGMNVADIAKKIHREPAEIIKKLFMMGVMVNQNQALDKDTIELLAVDYGMEPQEKVQVDIADIDKFFEPEAVVEENLTTRPPVVTIMGHVDHGKTTLLDTLRHSRVTSGEAGGITQHIGAYQLDIDGKPITFLDTPGHAAFTSMRARGASITDITILVVAADDGVMPQTIEAINHAKAAKVPIIVAVNKIDKPGANPDHVKQELSEHELIPEEWGGDTIFVNISAKFNQNIDELLENILLIAEVEDLKADPTQRAIGTVIEARLDKGKGPVATLLVQQG
ncbi:translation initiation factor IF-2, partial [Enterococcus faecalis]